SQHKSRPSHRSFLHFGRLEERPFSCRVCCKLAPCSYNGLHWVPATPRDTRATMENLYEGRDGIAKLASALMKILSEIEAAKKKNLGHIPEDLSGPNHVKYAAVEALAECVRRGIVPPWRLVVLVRRLMGVSNERKRRGHTKVPLSRLLSIQREKQLSGRV